MDILGVLLSYLLLYKYFALAAVVYSAALILPLPSNMMLMAVGAFASQGYFNFWLSLAIAVIANCLGDLTGYGLARRYGGLMMRRFKWHEGRFFGQLQEEFRRDAAVTVFLTRFAGWLSVPANVLAGFVDVSFFTFLFYDFLGNFIEPGVMLFSGYIFGNYWNSFSNLFEIFASIIAVLVVMFVLWRIHQRIIKKYST